MTSTDTASTPVSSNTTVARSYFAGLGESNYSPQSHQPPHKQWPAPVSARNLCTNPPVTPEMLIAGMLYRGGTMLISGQSKARKTYTLLDAAFSIASGVEWLGCATTKTPVIYLNFELQDFAIERRLKEIAGAKDMMAPEHLYFFNLRTHVTTIDIIEKELPARIKELGAGLVIIDPHYKISAVSGSDENSNTEQAELFTKIEAVCGAENAAVMLAHHFAKGNAAKKNQIDRASGGGVFARWPDVFMTMTDHKEQDAMTMEFALRNFKGIPPFVARWEHPIWVRDVGLDPSKLQGAGAPEKYPSSAAREKLSPEGMTNAEWRVATSWADSTFRRKRDELVETLKTVELRAGKYYPVAESALRIAQNRLDSRFGLSSQNRHNCPDAVAAEAVAKDGANLPAATSIKSGGGGPSGTRNEPENRLR